LSLRFDDPDSVVELYTEDDFRQLVLAAQAIPTFFGGLRELVDHRESGLVEKSMELPSGCRWVNRVIPDRCCCEIMAANSGWLVVTIIRLTLAVILILCGVLC
jgi:hypothetical protein